MCRSVLLIVSLALLLTTQPFQSSAQKGSMQAEEVVSQARAALGGESRLRGLRSLSAAGQLRRVFPDRERPGSLELDWLSPDIFRQVETMGFEGGVSVTVTGVFDGARARKESRVEAGGLPITVTHPGGRTESLSENERRQMRDGFMRYLPAMLLSPAASARFGDAGLVEVNGAAAHALDVRTEGGFNARLYLDPKTHLPLMLTYRGRPPLVTLDARGGQREGSQETELRVRFADYRAAGGLLWPHRITTEAGGRLLEELEVKLYKVNPAEVNQQSFGR